MSDVIEGNITPSIANATVNAGGKLLHLVELQERYGRVSPDTGNKVLMLTAEQPTNTMNEKIRALEAQIESLKTTA